MIRPILLFGLIVCLAFPFGQRSACAGETVVLLHGIARTSKSMTKLETTLQEAGYETRNITYPSRQYIIKDLANWVRKNDLTDSFWNENTRVHFVTHSMGGLVLRRFLWAYRNEIPEDKMGRVVMLAPPNQGSEVADFLEESPPYRWYYGSAGSELTTAVQDIRVTRESPWYDLGIIAGTKRWPYPVAAFLIPGHNDGRVSVGRSKIPGMKEHTTVSATHTFIMDHPDVHKMILRFFRKGSFVDE